VVDGGLTQHLERPEWREVAAGEANALDETDEPEERRYNLLAKDWLKVWHCNYSLPMRAALTTSNGVKARAVAIHEEVFRISKKPVP
jgi:hypothetical protein